jgi:uncharacterized membrane protein YebE (DUF533 family)
VASSSWIELAVASISMFADDGTLDKREVESLLHTALADGTIDDDERRVLGRIFSKVKESDVKPEVWQLICKARKQYDI